LPIILLALKLVEQQKTDVAEESTTSATIKKTNKNESDERQMRKGTDQDNSDKDVKITYVDVHKDSSSKSTDYSISKSNIHSYSKILVPDDGKEVSNKALNHAISLSNLSGAEIVILRIIENIEKMGDTSVSVSQNKEPDTRGGFKHNIEGELVNAMEGKIKKCVEAGAKNKISYEIKVGHAADQVMKACEETRYDLVVMTTSHLDSWLRSLFSEARKIISKINTPVLLVQ
jgi:nucleotide-binding universal stress UspA family protein